MTATPVFQGLMVMRASSADAIQSQEQESRKAESDNSVIFCRTNDPVYGNIFITGTTDTIQAAGITPGD